MIEKIRIAISKREWNEYQKWRKKRHIKRAIDIKIILIILAFFLFALGTRLGNINLSEKDISAYSFLFNISSWTFVLLGIIFLFFALFISKFVKYRN